ncbi:MAG TPA: hypothetical protein VKB86_19800, partial [Pyrinomonadaceae bacterium]|nr:hypothetical protein [Pyrinomonadaceae bacterium]
MSTLIMKRLLTRSLVIIWIILSIAQLSIGCISSSRGQADDSVSKLVGNWTGDSTCVGNLPSCHNEKIIY